ncbi:sensor histidine kinase [Vibrio sp. TBV020]|uniref:sensor histidine kinase n=1 Tax=Vibrio sp. TBV020 TaxID=3137398 RepID=UPI0038CDA2A4
MQTLFNLQSIYHRLFIALAAALVILSLTIFAIANLTLKGKTEALYDKMLVAVSQNIEEKLYIKDGKLHIDMFYFSIDSLSDVRDEKVFYRVVTESGKQLAGFEGIVLADNQDERITFYNVTYAGTDLRAVQYRVNTKLETVFIVVAESTQGRDATISESQKQIGVAALIFGFIAMIAIMLIIDKSLKPLKQLRSEIRSRSGTNLEPLELATPPEVNDLVQSLNSLMKRLSLSIEASRNFNADLSHQLKTPLAEMKMQLNMFRHDHQTDQLDGIEDNIDKMSRITQQMLHYANVQNSSMGNEHWQFTDVVALCREFCIKRAPLVFQRGQSLAFESDLEQAYCYVDDVMLESALLNLIENALKYAHSNKAEPEIILRVEKIEQSLTISIIDEGPGIDESHIEQLLDRHVRIDQTQQGSGLGLSIVNKIVEIHGAKLSIKNVQPQGLCVAIENLMVQR